MKRSMEMTMATKEKVSFKIENNVLIGKEVPINDWINIGELILNTFKFRPDFVGQVDGITGEEITFQEMRERSVKCALWLKKIGVQRNDIVTVCTSNCFDAFIPFLASLYIGATLTVWHEKRPINYRHYMQSNPKVIFTDIDKVLSILNVANMLKISVKIIVLFYKEEEEKEEEGFEYLESILSDDNFDKAEIDEFSCIKLESKDTVVILFSAGTTGEVRKHVKIPYAFFISPSNQHVPILSPNDVGMWNESLHWNISLLLTVRCILSCVKAVKITESLEISFCTIVEKYKVTWVFMKMSMSNHFYSFSEFKDYDLSSLKQIIFGGRLSILPDIFASFIKSLRNTSIIQVYCLPEVGMITYQKKTGQIGSSGYVCNNVNLVITHYITGNILNAYRFGIIHCKSPCLTNGCFSSIPTDLIFLPDFNGWFCTDDIGYYDTNGKLFVLDRIKNIIQYRNYYFLPAHIEELLRKHPKVKDCAAIPLYNCVDIHHPLAIVVPNKGEKIEEQEIIQFVEDKGIDCIKLRGGVLFKQVLKYLPNRQLNRRILRKWTNDDLKDKAFHLRKASQKKT